MQLSPAGQQAINDIAQRHGFSPDAVTSMLMAVIAGNGSMAQFSHPEFGGSGQWMRGGMIMVSDMFNNVLKGRVDSLCTELSNLVANQPGLTQSGSFQSQSQSGGPSNQFQSSGGGYAPMQPSFQGQAQGSGQDSLFVPGSFGNWWPGDLGSPSSTGGQNNVRYAYFPGSRRLAIDVGGQVTVYDTLDHQIGGVSQQQSGGSSLTFSSQYGTVDVASLPVVSGVAPAPSYAPQPQQGATMPAPGAGQSEVLAAIEKLADLHSRGILSDQEFSTKKAELLSRL